MDSLIRKVIPIEIEEEMKRSYLDYSMSVIVSRALPDLRDGLKPVHRRILYSMYESGYHHNKPHRKSARIVGDVMGKYHPHGDMAIYDSLVRMAQDFSLLVPLIDGQGNFGSIDGDNAAAARYTESRLTKAAGSLLFDIDKSTVDFQPNYDGSESEPKVLPATYPNLLINGSSGIAVGMATNIPPHNLSEVIDACIAYIEDNDISIEGLMEHIKGPDFPTAGSIIGISPIKSAYHTGRGIITIRGKSEVEEDAKGRGAIIIKEIPYAVNKSKLIEKIAELVNNKTIEGISDIRDESDRSEIRIVIELKRDAHTEVVLNKIYSYTQLQVSFGINMLALDNGIPKLLNLKDVISGFITFRKEVITKRTIHLLEHDKSRAHVLIGLHISVSNIDEVIRIIKGADDANAAKIQLMSKKWGISEISNWVNLIDNSEALSHEEYSLSEKQAKAILDMRLHRLTALEKNKIIDEIEALVANINEYLSILNSEEKLFLIMKEELLATKQFSKPRMTNIEDAYLEKDEEDFIPDEEMVVVVTLNGYIKRTSLNEYRTQNRGGRGKSGQSVNEEDVVTQIFVGNSKDLVLFFSNFGRVYSMKLYKIPLANPGAKGRSMVNLLQLGDKEQIVNVLSIDKIMYQREASLLFATKKGNIRRSDLSDFENIRTNGKIAIKLDEDDGLISVKTCVENDHILLATKNGKAIKFGVDVLRIIKSKESDGVRAIKLGKGDVVVGMAIIENGVDISVEEREAYFSIPIDQRLEMKASEQNLLLDYTGMGISAEIVLNLVKSEQFIITITSKGYGKRSSCYEYRTTGRGGQGVINTSNSAKIGHVVSVISVNENDDLILITNKGQVIRCKVNTVRSVGRNSSGVILFRTTEDEHIVSAFAILEDEV